MLIHVFFEHTSEVEEERCFCLTMSLSSRLPPVPCCQPWETKWAPPAQRWTNCCEPSPSQLFWWLLQQRLFARSNRSVLETWLLPCHQPLSNTILPFLFLFKIVGEGEDDVRNFRLLDKSGKAAADRCPIAILCGTCRCDCLEFRRVWIRLWFSNINECMCRAMFQYTCA